jgi:hypothetical protein
MAAALAGCGGSSSDSSSSQATTGAAPTTSGEAGQGPASQSKPGAQGQSQGKGSGKVQPGQGEAGGSGSTKHVVAPLRVSGGGSAQFRVKGGDNSIQEFGDEGGESELREMAEIVHSFFVARAEGRWSTACSHLAKRNVEQLEQLTTKSSCSAALAAFTEPLSPQLEREVTTVDAGSFRHEGAQGFLIYYGAGGTVYSMPMFEEGGSWKVAALIGTALS